MIFIGMIILFFGVMIITSKGTNISELNSDGEHILKTLESDNQELGIIEKDKINEQRLNQLVQKDYEEIKTQVGVKNDFCIFIEDENGNVIPIKVGDDKYYGIGTDDVKVGGRGCSKLVG